MNKHPKVSIICTVYKHEKYLRQCLDGFVMQKTEFPFEILVNDDCSPDNSAAIVREYETQYPDLFRCVYQNENQYSKGMLPWWEVLFPMAKGEYLAICEGDDYWIDSYKLQKQVSFLDNHPDYVACFHNARVFDGKSYHLFNSVNENHFPSTEDIIKRLWFIATPSIVCRNIITEFPKWRKGVINEDYLLELLLAREGKFYYMDDVMAVYRQEGQGISTVLNANQDKLYDSLISLLSKMKEEYNGIFADAFDTSIANYKRMKQDYLQELYYEKYPLLKVLRPKTYKRAIKKWLR